MSDLIAALDNALIDAGEDFILRRVVGAANSVNTDVTCRGRIDGVTAQEIAAGVKATELKVIFSPTQINNAQWPGGGIPQVPPFNVDQRVPRLNGDKVILRGMSRDVTFVNPYFIAGELVRIEIRVSG